MNDMLLDEHSNSSFKGSDTLEHDIETIIRNLKIIGSLKENEKICTQTGGVFVLKPADRMNAFIRYYYGETREKNLTFIEQEFNKAFENIDIALKKRERLIEVDETSMTREQMQEHLKNKQLITRLQKEINETRSKIRGLQITYANDSQINARIRVLEDTIEDKLELTKENVCFLDKKLKEKRIAAAAVVVPIITAAVTKRSYK